MMDINLIAFIKDGPYRSKVLKELNDSPKIPSELAENLEIHRSSMSRILSNLEEKGLIRSSKKEGRTVVYVLTDDGKELLEYL